jgi:hypothetical protein
MQFTPALWWALSCHCWVSPAEALVWQLTQSAPAGCPHALGSSFTLAAHRGAETQSARMSKTRDGTLGKREGLIMFMTDSS